MKDREEKSERNMQELFYKPIIVCKDDMGNFEEPEIKKIRQIKEQIVSLVEWTKCDGQETKNNYKQITG